MSDLGCEMVAHITHSTGRRKQHDRGIVSEYASERGFHAAAAHSARRSLAGATVQQVVQRQSYHTRSGTGGGTSSACPDQHSVSWRQTSAPTCRAGGYSLILAPTWHTLSPRSRHPRALTARSIGQHRLPPESRVFVGGGFAHLDSHLRPIRDILDLLGYEGVVAADYAVPPDWRNDDVARGLMHVCHYGVFELSGPAGQQIEIAELPDRKHTPARTLAVWDLRLSDHPAVSYGMVLERLADWRVVPNPYNSLGELRAILKAWLPARRTQ